jgi:Entner-Doudoroff aldolase
VDLTQWLQRCPIVAILRGIKTDEAESICSALEEAGIAIVEVPLNSPNALLSIATLSRVFGDRMLIGAGTLTEPKQVAEVAAAGGQLIVTPHADTAIVRAAKTAGLFAAPGFFNPTEAFALLHAGADALKLFPSEVGPRHSDAQSVASGTPQGHNHHPRRRNRREKYRALDSCGRPWSWGRVIGLQARGYRRHRQNESQSIIGRAPQLVR